MRVIVLFCLVELFVTGFCSARDEPDGTASERRCARWLRGARRYRGHGFADGGLGEGVSLP